MKTKSKQKNYWVGSFGDDYSKRNSLEKNTVI